MVKASLSMGHSTYAYVRPLKRDHTFSSKLQIHKQFQSLGGELGEHEKLVSVLKQVDVLISTLAVPQHLDQLKIISAMTEAGNIKGKKIGRTFEKIHVPKEEIVKLSETLTFPENIPVSILHNIFIKGDQMRFELTEDDLEASKLYPDHKYTRVDSLLDLCLINPPKPKRAAFA
ncbi:hypothetical protein GH714_008745 [Hevea brasiliensis]|uniref:NmrA-like domain-containing protein n=1 Tax=Hevea brasiliensis TaxID=3981 RepID=A0A6A6NCI3_HEVBR|nr:hypothetical protein GH714_008745 [Hevea brasiliensis]